jgi:hypothetical protein
MRTCLSAFLVVVLMLAGGIVPATAQSLADVARREAERRKGVKDAGRVLTNKDVPNVSRPAPVPASDLTTEPTKGADAADKAGGTPAGAAQDAKSAKDEDRPKDQKYWSERQQALRTQLERDQTYLDALQSRVNALTTDFVNRDDPAERAVIATDRQKAIEEMARLNAAILDDKKAIAGFEDEAHRAAVPPGWLR